VVRSGKRRTTHALFHFDRPFHERYGLIAGVDEVGRGPLAGPVVAAAVLLPLPCRIPQLNDSKLLSPEDRRCVYRVIQRTALAIGVGIVEHAEIDQLNIYWASFAAMKRALERLVLAPAHVLVDGFRIPQGPPSQTGVIDGDAKSAHIAAASIVAKVTRDSMIEFMDRRYPGYGFRLHKGYATALHLERLEALGPCPIHRRSFAPVRQSDSLSDDD